MTEWIGKMLGKVRIDSLLARGGIAEVYLGEHVALQREVAVKILRNQYEDDSQLLERFEREARVVAKLRHSNIVQVFDFDTVEGRPYLVMEYVPGISLSRYLHILHGRNGRLELPIVNRIITQVAYALQYAHESGVVHRDVKPGNILLTSRSEKVSAGKPLPADFQPILTDFGLVRFLNSSRQTTMGVIAGTPAYMSPEQARGETTDERTDIYSLGIVLYELLTGHVPFDGETTMSIILKQVTEPPPPVPGLSPELQHVLDRSLAKKPEDRYQTPDALAAAFNAVISGITDSETVMESDSKITGRITKVGYRAKKRKNWIPAVVTGGLVVLLGGFFLFRQTGTASSPTLTGLPAQPGATVQSASDTLAPTALSGPAGIVHFQDSGAILDQVALRSYQLTAPPVGSHYEAWISDGITWQSLGILTLDPDGKGELFSKEAGEANLLSAYDRVFVTIELKSDNDPSPSTLVAYTSALPVEGITHLRQLLVTSPETPNGIALIQGLNADILLLDRSARAMQSALQKGDDTLLRQNAEAILNLLAGDQSEKRKDWNGDGQVTDPSDGFGLLLNGAKPGYIQAVAAQAGDAVNSEGATENMTRHGEQVQICSQNLVEWTTELRDILTDLLDSPSGADLSQPVLDTVRLAGQLLNGFDSNNNGIEALPGECGMSSLYGYAYSMADMVLLPFDLATLNLYLTETPTPTSTHTPSFTITPGDNTNGTTPIPPPATKKPNPTQKPKPTKKN